MSTYGRVQAGSPSECRVTASYPSGAAVFHLQGELDASTAGGLRLELGAAVGQPAVLLELSGVGFIDSIGLGVLVAVIRRVHEHGGMVALFGADPRRGVTPALVTAGIDRLVFVADSAESAMDWLLASQAGART